MRAEKRPLIITFHSLIPVIITFVLLSQMTVLKTQKDFALRLRKNQLLKILSFSYLLHGNFLDSFGITFWLIASL